MLLSEWALDEPRHENYKPRHFILLPGLLVCETKLAAVKLCVKWIENANTID